MASLQNFAPAFLGGLFFTFSVRASVTLLSIGAAWLRNRVFSRNRFILIIFLLFWLGSLLVLNHRGFSSGASCYFFAISPLVFLATLRWMPSGPGKRGWVNGTIHTIPVVVLALLCASQIDSYFFVDFRDIFLLSNPVRIEVNDFYYDYTLYPAEAFKSHDQKLLRTCSLQNLEKESLLARLEGELLNYDYLSVATDDAVDLKVSQNGDVLSFNKEGRTIFQTTPADFFSHPGALLHEFSAKGDRHGFFRQFAFFSLVMGLPLALYVILHTLVRLLCCFFLPVRTSSLIASILCLIVGVSILIPFKYMRETTIELKDVPQALASELWQERVAALRIIERKGMEVSSFQPYPRLLASPHIPER